MSKSPLIAIVQVHVRPEDVEGFRAASLLNATESRREPGVLRFDVLQETDDPTRFVLIEVFREPAAAAAHRETAHYQRWRDTVAPMMAEPRSNRKYADAGDGAW
jgi:autoinducer 2-degrading protein